jgi:hypothetical protein
LSFAVLYIPQKALQMVANDQRLATNDRAKPWYTS